MKKKQINESDTTAREKSSEGLKTKLASRLRHSKKLSSIRITNDNIKEHREDIIIRGRKLKYPVQYSKKSLIITTVVVALVALSIFAFWLYNGLYRQQETGDFYYSVTKIAPLNVAKVGDAPVRYQDYLRRIRADIHYYLTREGRSFNSKEGAKELDYHKRKNLLVAEKAAYVRYLAKQQGVTVSSDEVDTKVKVMRDNDKATEDMLITTLQNFYGWTLDDFKSTIYDQLLEQKLSYQIDQEARKKIDKVASQLKAGTDFATLAKSVSDDSASKANGGAVVVKKSDSDPTGIVDRVSKLKVGQLTGVEQARIDNEDYYYVARLDAKTDDQIKYSIITVKLTKLDNDFAHLQKDGKIKEYISVPAESEYKGN